MLNNLFLCLREHLHSVPIWLIRPCVCLAYVVLFMMGLNLLSDQPVWIVFVWWISPGTMRQALQNDVVVVFFFGG